MLHRPIETTPFIRAYPVSAGVVDRFRARRNSRAISQSPSATLRNARLEMLRKTSRRWALSDVSEITQLLNLKKMHRRAILAHDSRSTHQEISERGEEDRALDWLESESTEAPGIDDDWTLTASAEPGAASDRVDTISREGNIMRTSLLSRNFLPRKDSRNSPRNTSFNNARC